MLAIGQQGSKWKKIKGFHNLEISPCQPIHHTIVVANWNHLQVNKKLVQEENISKKIQPLIIPRKSSYANTDR